MKLGCNKPPFALYVITYVTGFHCAYKFKSASVEYVAFAAYVVPLPFASVFQPVNVYPVLVGVVELKVKFIPSVFVWFDGIFVASSQLALYVTGYVVFTSGTFNVVLPADTVTLLEFTISILLNSNVLTDVLTFATNFIVANNPSSGIV